MAAVVLTIDIDNSTTNVGLFDQNGKLCFRSGLTTSRNPTRDQCAISLMNLFTLYHADLKEVSGAVISSVVPSVTAHMSGAVELLTGLVVNRDYRVWDYRDQPGNLMGQICPRFTALWVPVGMAAMGMYRLVDGGLDKLMPAAKYIPVLHRTTKALRRKGSFFFMLSVPPSSSGRSGSG